jgi:glycosyltransferase involved in cell wall biosynthesis
MNNISVLILTLNEEINIAPCLDTVSWSDDIIVFDSLSADRTVTIGTEKGARIIQRPFDDWSSHHNWAVQNIQFKHPWVLYLDADERCPLELAQDIQRFTSTDSGHAACRIRRKDFFMDVWLKHAQLYPTWLVRLFRPEKIHYERLVNPIAHVNGSVGEVQAHIFHYPFSHGVAHWIDRHNRYSDMEAKEWMELRELNPLLFKPLFSADPNMRRKLLKELFSRLPARPLIKFVYYYLIRRGFIDGRAGFSYAMLQAFYEYMIQLKVSEIKRKSIGQPL